MAVAWGVLPDTVGFAGSDHISLERVLAGFANHPNVAACVLVGLGCEVSQASEIVEVVSGPRSPAIRTSGVPHCEQNRAPSGFGWPHPVQ